VTGDEVRLALLGVVLVVAAVVAAILLR